MRFDDPQQRVIDHGPGPLCLLGGPGTGKTTVLAERFIALVRSGCTPDRILFLVPNRAQKMALQDVLTRRLLFDEGFEAVIDVPVHTWHGFANHLVSRHYDMLAYPEPPVLLTSPEQWGDVRDALMDEPESNWPHHRHLLRNRGFVDEVVDFCIRAEQRLLEPQELDALAEARPAWGDIVRFFRAHRQRLRDRSRVDYPTLLADAVDLIANYEDVRDGLHLRYQHILVDDGQELALVQQRMLRFLTGFPDRAEGAGDRSLVVAADPDSAIETFRGADPGWLQGFEKEFGPHETVTLPISYRTGPELGAAAARLISGNGEAEHRPRSYAGEGGIEILRFGNVAAEVEAVARELRLAHLKDDVAYEDMAVLLTSPRSMLPPLERALVSLEVPFSIAAPDRPLAREPVVRAFVDLAQFSFDDETEPERVLELLRSPLVGLDDGDVRELERLARLQGTPLIAMLHDPPQGISEDAGAKLAELRSLRDLIRAKRARPADEAFWVVWDNSRLCKTLQQEARARLDAPANRDLDALVAFSHALGRFVERRRGTGTFEEYLHAIGRADFGSDPWLPPERRGGGVQILSFHGAKGKEWALVAVCGVVEGAIPKGRRATGLFDPYFLDESSPAMRLKKNEAEDRRVLYVAVTRARSRCLVTTSPGPTRKGLPSRFIEELAGEIPEITPLPALPALTFSEAAARYRKTLSDVSAPAASRVAALLSVAEVCRLDPECRAARPSEWWWRWDWTTGAPSIRQQQSRPDDNIPDDKLRTSYSRISTYDNCGLQYLCSVVLGLDPESSHNMAFGSWVHKVFEEIELNKIQPPEAYKLYAKLFDDKVFPNKAMARQFRRDGELMIERYGRYLKPYEAALAEVDFRIDIDGNVVTGRIDRVDAKGKGVVVTDYKTSRNPVQWDEAKKSLQLAIYYMAAKQEPAIAALGDPIGQHLVYPAKVARGDVARRTQTPEQAEEAIQRLPELIQGVLAEDFRPKTDADCQWCKFKPLCPLWNEGKEVPA